VIPRPYILLLFQNRPPHLYSGVLIHITLRWLRVAKAQDDGTQVDTRGDSSRFAVNDNSLIGSYERHFDWGQTVRGAFWLACRRFELRVLVKCWTPLQFEKILTEHPGLCRLSALHLICRTEVNGKTTKPKTNVLGTFSPGNISDDRGRRFFFP
jgi:hypothetical protein